MGLSHSTYYYRSGQKSLEAKKEEADLRDRIEQIVVELARYGYRRVTYQLRREGFKVNHKRVARIMREQSLQCQVKRRWVKTTDSDHGYRIYPNLVKGLEIKGRNQVWVADITYIRILTGFVYLAVVLDLFSRKVIGWALSEQIDGEITLAALRMALEERGSVKGCLHHSDRGVQYACHAYVEELQAAGMRISMARKGNPYDNAAAESFMKTLKCEEVYLWDYHSLEDVKHRIPYFLQEVYNQKRLHSALGYITPDEFEQMELASVA
jgi:transposase InsO family protein